MAEYLPEDFEVALIGCIIKKSQLNRATNRFYFKDIFSLITNASKFFGLYGFANNSPA